MTFERLIHDYLDEGLSEPMQEVLFGQLSSNSELRIEFNKQMKLHLLAKDDFENIAPPTELTNKVFLNAGFSAPFPSLPGFKISYLFGLIPILFALYFLTDIDNNINRDLASENSISIQSGNKAINSNILGVNSSNSNSDIIANDEINKSNNSENGLVNSINNSNKIFRGKSSFVASNKENTSNSKKSNQSFSQSNDSDEHITYLHERNMDFMGRPSFIISSSPIKESLISVTKVNQPVININSPSIDNSFVMSANNRNIGDDITSMAIIIKGINNSSLNQNIASATLPIANYAFAIVYKFENNWAILAEYSKENFFQEFQNTNADGINYTTKQNPSLSIISAGLRYTAKDMFNSNIIYPFLQANAGYTTIGAVSKLIAGLEYRVTNELSIIPSYEFSNLVYANQFGNYFAFNNGFSLGLSYNFNERK